MPTELKMPALSPTMEEGTLAKWLVKEGDEVKSGDILAEIETDKATMEFEAVDEGKIARILVPEAWKSALRSPFWRQRERTYQRLPRSPIRPRSRPRRLQLPLRRQMRLPNRLLLRPRRQSRLPRNLLSCRVPRVTA